MAKQVTMVEQMRESVLEQELAARSWKAFYEKMHYTLECEKIKEEYDVVITKQREKLEAEMKASVDSAVENTKPVDNE